MKIIEKIINRFKKSSSGDNSTKKPKLFAADMWAVFNLAPPDQRYQKFLERSRPAFKHLIDGILLHEEILVPTQDFLSLSIMIGVLGEDAVLDLLEKGCLKFLRVKGAFAYIGNGGGIKTFEILTEDEKPIACRRPLEEAVNWALNSLNPKPNELSQLSTLVIANTREIDAVSIEEVIRHETYMDVLNSPYLRNLFALRNQQMNNLFGIAPNQVRIYGGPDSDWRGDEVDIVMSLAQTNIELLLAQNENCTDVATASPTGHLIKAKAERSLGGIEAANAFAFIREISEVPDIGEGVLEKKITVKNLLKLRETRNAEQFRIWFHAHCRDNPVKAAKECNKLFRQVPMIQSVPMRILRFIITNVPGYVPIPGVGPAISTAVGIIDSFFLENWCRGKSPKFFIDDLRQLNGNPNGRR